MAPRRTRKPKRTAAQVAAVKALNARPRGPNGAPLSNAALAAYKAEQLQRVVDRAFMSPVQRERADAAIARANSVKQEKRERYQRFQRNRGAYQWHAKPNKQTLADAALIEQDTVPAPTDVLPYGALTEYIWTWQGNHALQTAQDFLLLARHALPSDSMGYLAMGNGHGKNATWIGTRFGDPEYIWRHSQTFLSSQSQNTVSINQLPFGAQDPSIWVEVKLTTKGRVSHVDNNSRAKRVTRKATGAVGRNRGKARR